MSAFIKGGNGLTKVSKKQEAMVGRRKAAGSNINVSTAIEWQLSCSEMSSLKYAKFFYLKQLLSAFPLR